MPPSGTTVDVFVERCDSRHCVLELQRRDRFAGGMVEPTDRFTDGAPPLGSWPRTYIATLVLAVVVIALLWLLTATCNIPLGSAR